MLTNINIQLEQFDILNIIAFICVALIGFASHRGNLCNVAAVRNIIFHKKPQMLAMLVQSVLWMAIISGLLVMFFKVAPKQITIHQPLGWTIIGGLLFGAGSSINNGCSLSTVNRLANGELRMLFTLLGVTLGIGGWVICQPHISINSTSEHIFWLKWPNLAKISMSILMIWLAWRIRGFLLLFSRRTQASLFKMLMLPQYHLSVTVAIFGIAGSILFITQDVWSYTSFLTKSLNANVNHTQSPAIWHLILVGGLFLGTLASALQRNMFKLRFVTSSDSLFRNIFGGFCMGLGGTLVPGGNDSMLLNGLPSISLAALIAYLSMLLGIAIGLLLIERKPNMLV